MASTTTPSLLPLLWAHADPKKERKSEAAPSKLGSELDRVNEKKKTHRRAAAARPQLEQRNRPKYQQLVT